MAADVILPPSAIAAVRERVSIAATCPIPQELAGLDTVPTWRSGA